MLHVLRSEYSSVPLYAIWWHACKASAVFLSSLSDFFLSVFSLSVSYFFPYFSPFLFLHRFFNRFFLLFPFKLMQQDKTTYEYIYLLFIFFLCLFLLSFSSLSYFFPSIFIFHFFFQSLISIYLFSVRNIYSYLLFTFL